MFRSGALVCVLLVGLSSALPSIPLPTNFNDPIYLMSYMSTCESVSSKARSARIIGPSDVSALTTKGREIKSWLSEPEHRDATPEQLQERLAEYQAVAAPILKEIADSPHDVTKFVVNGS